MKKSILLISSEFHPTPTGIAVYTTDLAKTLAEYNYEVHVITSRNFASYGNSLNKFTSENFVFPPEVKVSIIKNRFQGRSGLHNRLLAETAFFIKGIYELRKLKEQHFDLIISVVPFVSCGVIAKYYSRKFKNPGIVIVQDLSSLALRESGIPGGKKLFRIGENLEVGALSWANLNIAISDSIAEFLKSREIPNSRLRTIHNYSVTEGSDMGKVEAKLKFGFNPDEYLVMYTGSFGYKQNLSNLISAAECLRNDVDIRFLCIGGGHQEQYLIDKVKTFSNISLLPPVPGSEFSHLLKAADILVLTERATIRAMSLPSKLTSYFMANRPVLAAISNESATYRFAGKYMYVVDPDNPLALSEGIKYLKNNPMFCSNLAKYAQNFAEEVMSSTVGRRAYLGSIGEVISRNLSGE